LLVQRCGADLLEGGGLDLLVEALFAEESGEAIYGGGRF
jgi:hypothetical protein